MLKGIAIKSSKDKVLGPPKGWAFLAFKPYIVNCIKT